MPLPFSFSTTILIQSKWISFKLNIRQFWEVGLCCGFGYKVVDQQRLGLNYTTAKMDHVL